jgi:hypothetical protein
MNFNEAGVQKSSFSTKLTIYSFIKQGPSSPVQNKEIELNDTLEVLTILFSSRSKRTQRVLKLNKFKHGKYTNELS